MIYNRKLEDSKDNENTFFKPASGDDIIYSCMKHVGICWYFWEFLPKGRIWFKFEL